jgi:basic membrane lipoprotein Med (substrate-binding protein (PBP1-ABC) superfamily)
MRQRRSRAGLRAACVLAGLLGAAPQLAAGPPPVRVAAIYTTLIEQPWAGCIHAALAAARDRGEATYEYSETVAHNDIARTMRQYAESGVQLVIGDSYAMEAAARAVARDYPAVSFLFASSGPPQAPNFSVFNSFLEESCYLSGMYAGAMTRTNRIGLVGGFPIPEVNREMHAFIAGARELNPNASFMVTFIGAWWDPPRAKEAAFAQIDQGADVLYAERFGVCDAARDRHKLAFGYISNLQPAFPDTLVTSAIWNVAPMVAHAIEAVRSGRFRAEDYADYSRMRRGGNDIAPLGTFAGRVPAAVSARVDGRRAAILSGAFAVPVDESVPKSSP